MQLIRLSLERSELLLYIIKTGREGAGYIVEVIVSCLIVSESPFAAFLC